MFCGKYGCQATGYATKGASAAWDMAIAGISAAGNTVSVLAQNTPANLNQSSTGRA